MRRVYLDQNHWVYLARAIQGRPRTAAEADAALVVQAGVEAGLASFPLSLAHVEETWRRRRADKRIPLADTMSAISRNHAIAPPWALLPAEIDRALASRFGEPATPRTIQPFGIGLSHMTAGRAPQLDPKIVQALLSRYPVLDARRVTDWIDALMRSGPNADLPFEGMQPPPRDLAEAFAVEEQAQLERFREFAATSDEKERGVAARMFLDIRDAVHEAQIRTTVSTDELLALGAEGVTSFMQDLPSRDAMLALATVQHRNPQTRWEPNDLNDLVYVSLAVGYCDIVVTERKWAAILNASDVPARRRTVVLSRLADLPAALVAL